MTYTKYDSLRKSYDMQKQVVLNMHVGIANALAEDKFLLAELRCDMLKVQLEALNTIANRMGDEEN